MLFSFISLKVIKNKFMRWSHSIMLGFWQPNTNIALEKCMPNYTHTWNWLVDCTALVLQLAWLGDSKLNFLSKNAPTWGCEINLIMTTPVGSRLHLYWSLCTGFQSASWFQNSVTDLSVVFAWYCTIIIVYNARVDYPIPAACLLFAVFFTARTLLCYFL